MSESLEKIRKYCKLVSQAPGDDHFHRLGMRFISVDKGRVAMELPYSEALVGNPVSGVIHGGVLTALLDNCCGVAASTVLETLGLCPTLDLRIDYMGSAVPGEVIYAEARVYRRSRHVIFTRGRAYQADPDQPVAYCVANFARLDPDVMKLMSDSFLPILNAMED